MANPEDHIKELFGEPETGPDPDAKANLPEKGQVLGESETEEQQAQRIQAEEDGLTSGSGQKEEPKEEAAPAETDEDVSRDDRVAAARLKQINRLRARDRRKTEKIDKMEKELADIRKTISGGDDEDAAAEQQLAANPALKKVLERVEGIEKSIKRPDAVPEGYSEEDIADELEVHNYGLEAVSAFKAKSPDWDEAYEHVRQQMAASAGIQNWPEARREQQLNVWEHQFTQAMMDLGQDPAAAIYKKAGELGWKRANGSAPVAPPVGNGKPIIPDKTVRRIRDAVQTPSLSLSGSGSPQGGDTITRDEFYRRYTQPQRIALFNSDNGADIFEALDSRGEVHISLLTRR